MYQITALPGDGIGPEIMQSAVQVLQTVAKKHNIELVIVEALIGGSAIDATGSPLPQETLAQAKKSDAVLLGAVGGPKWDGRPDGVRPEQGLLGIRSGLRLYANLRPAIVYNVLRESSPLKNEILGDGLDIMVVRELTGGIYFGDNGRDTTAGEPSAYDTERYSKSEIIRIGKVAFETARGRNGKLCSVDKANVLESSRLWRETMIELSADYPDVTLSHMYVDNAAMQLVRNPRQFDTIVTSNIFGDILSDEASQITGSIGMLPSASLGEGHFGMYEPIHGSAPDITGQDLANPIGMILSAAMMLRYSLGEVKAAEDIEGAVSAVLEAGGRTKDLAPDDLFFASNTEMTKMIIATLGE